MNVVDKEISRARTQVIISQIRLKEDTKFLTSLLKKKYYMKYVHTYFEEIDTHRYFYNFKIKSGQVYCTLLDTTYLVEGELVKQPHVYSEDRLVGNEQFISKEQFYKETKLKKE